MHNNPSSSVADFQSDNFVSNYTNKQIVNSEEDGGERNVSVVSSQSISSSIIDNAKSIGSINIPSERLRLIQKAKRDAAPIPSAARLHVYSTPTLVLSAPIHVGTNTYEHYVNLRKRIFNDHIGPPVVETAPAHIQTESFSDNINVCRKRNTATTSPEYSQSRSKLLAAVKEKYVNCTHDVLTGVRMREVAA
jgi:hypothetical protein